LAAEISPELYQQYGFQKVFDEPRLHVLFSDSATTGTNCGYSYHGTKMKALSIDIDHRWNNIQECWPNSMTYQIINGV
jgi:hypothetical protein